MREPGPPAEVVHVSDDKGAAAAPVKTALYDEHVAAGGRMVAFAGWMMPVQYSGIVEEHNRVRQAVGLFDVSHMGEIEITGPGAEAFVNAVTANDTRKLQAGRAQYSCFPNEKGGVRDDCVVYRRGPEDFLVVVNASNCDKIWAHLSAVHPVRGAGSTLRNRSRDFSLISLQGPRAAELLAPLTDVQLSPIKFYGFAEGKVAGVPAIVSRTGYTGEDGFELFVAWDQGPAMWRRLLGEGARFGILPVGLGARDTLRLEMRYALYGHELGEDISPLEAGLDRWVKLDKPDFIGREALLAERERGPRRGLIGITTTGAGAVPRPEVAVRAGGRTTGQVVSGTFSPSLRHGIAVALVERPLPPAGSAVELDIRGRAVPGTVVDGPFYRR
jgi:aminomethyltransferase